MFKNERATTATTTQEFPQSIRPPSSMRVWKDGISKVWIFCLFLSIWGFGLLFFLDLWFLCIFGLLNLSYSFFFWSANFIGDFILKYATIFYPFAGWGQWSDQFAQLLQGELWDCRRGQQRPRAKIRERNLHSESGGVVRTGELRSHRESDWQGRRGKRQTSLQPQVWSSCHMSLQLQNPNCIITE